MLRIFAQRLYLRIWLAVIGGVAVLTLLVGWAWRIAAEQNEQPQSPPARQVALRDGSGNTLFTGQAQREFVPPGQKLEWHIETSDGQRYVLEMSPRPDHTGPPPPNRRDNNKAAFWQRPPFGFLWMLGLVSGAVILGVFPIIRRLLQRLETLQRGVQRFGEGDLSVRVAETGQDEVADLARQFNAAAERIQTLVQSHKSLLANASHELRSPLARIRMGLELMQNGQPTPASRAEIERNIAELDQLVDEILLASRLDADAADIGADEAVDLLGLAAEECARIDADLDLDGDHWSALQMQGNAKLLRRALRNLLENARRYSQGPIELRMALSGPMAELQICDHGPGVPPAQRERIFEPFYRLPGASERSGGVGLGLALVRTIAQRHNGSVHCQERPDGLSGACFVLRLPVGY